MFNPQGLRNSPHYQTCPTVPKAVPLHKQEQAFKTAHSHTASRRDLALIIALTSHLFVRGEFANTSSSHRLITCRFHCGRPTVGAGVKF